MPCQSKIGNFMDAWASRECSIYLGIAWIISQLQASPHKFTHRAIKYRRCIIRPTVYNPKLPLNVGLKECNHIQIACLKNG